jgi:DNA-binding response OmpR family regulator
MKISTHKEADIILIDDDADDQEIFAEAIKDAEPGTKFCSLKHEHELYSYFENGEIPHLFFLDWGVQCNFEKKCLEQIKMQKHLKDVPIIIYSSLNAEAVIEDLYSRGASLFVNKPSSFAELVRLLKAILKINWDHFNLDSAKNDFLKDFDSVKILPSFKTNVCRLPSSKPFWPAG